MLRAIICDDEQPAIDLIADFLEQSDQVELVAKCQSAAEALTVIERGGVDLVFFDVEMPELTGVAAAAQIGVEPKPLLVFVTAHPEYAVEAFGIDAIDYVLKPIRRDRLLKSVDKAVRMTRLIQESRERTEPDEQLNYPQESDDVIKIQDAGSFHFLSLKDILWIEAAGDYSLLHKTGAEIAVRRTISSLEGELPSNRFLRIHRSAIISVDHISEIRRLAKGEAEIKMGAGAWVKSSRSYRDVIAGLID